MSGRPAGIAIDLHCHILPALDDGARDLDDAIAMAQQAQSNGIIAICATPHIRSDHSVRIDELRERRAELSTALAAAGCRTRILPGGEVAAATLERLTDHDLREVSLGGAERWILLEPDPGPLDHRLERAVDVLESRGFRAVVAHPERHLAPDLVERLTRVVRRGALVQATAASLLDEESRAGMLALAESGVLHVLGSDSHSASFGRPVALAAALEVMGRARPVARHLRWVAVAAPLGVVRGRQDLTPPFAPGCGQPPSASV